LAVRTHDDLFYADFADYADLILETRILGFKDLIGLGCTGLKGF